MTKYGWLSCYFIRYFSNLRVVKYPTWTTVWEKASGIHNVLSKYGIDLILSTNYIRPVSIMFSYKFRHIGLYTGFRLAWDVWSSKPRVRSYGKKTPLGHRCFFLIVCFEFLRQMNTCKNKCYVSTEIEIQIIHLIRF